MYNGFVKYNIFPGEGAQPDPHRWPWLLCKHTHWQKVYS